MPAAPPPLHRFGLDPSQSARAGAYRGSLPFTAASAGRPATPAWGSTSCLLRLGTDVPPELLHARRDADNQWSGMLGSVPITMYAAPAPTGPAGEVPADLAPRDFLAAPPSGARAPAVAGLTRLVESLHNSAVRAHAAGLPSPVVLRPDNAALHASFFAKTGPSEAEAPPTRAPRKGAKPRKPPHRATIYVPDVFACIDGVWYLVAAAKYAGETLVGMLKRIGESARFEPGHLLSTILEHLFLSDDDQRARNAKRGKFETLAAGTFPRLLAWVASLLQDLLPGRDVSLHVVFQTARAAQGCSRESAKLVLWRQEALLLYLGNAMAVRSGLGVAWQNVKQATGEEDGGGFGIESTVSRDIKAVGLPQHVIDSLAPLTRVPAMTERLVAACKEIGGRAGAAAGGKAAPAAAPAAPAPAPAAEDPLDCTDVPYEGAGGAGGGSGSDSDEGGPQAEDAQAAPLPRWVEAAVSAAARGGAAAGRVHGLSQHLGALLGDAPRGGERLGGGAPEVLHARAFARLERLRLLVRSTARDIAGAAAAQAATLLHTTRVIATAALLQRADHALLTGHADLVPGLALRLARARPLDAPAVRAAARLALALCGMHYTDAAPPAQWLAAVAAAPVAAPPFVSLAATERALEAELLLLFPATEEEGWAMRRGGWQRSTTAGHLQLDGLHFRLGQLQSQLQSLLRWGGRRARATLGALLVRERGALLREVQLMELCVEAARGRAAAGERLRRAGAEEEEGGG